jgi:poly-gamma-glutamate synthesis protein (capsule biosynthesis protein)
VDAGADVVIGNHSHVYGGVEQYKGKYIIYSLGNFCFGGNKNPGDKDCTIFQQTFVVSRDGTVSDGGINIIPARVSGKNNTNDFQPCILSGDAAAKQLSKIADVSRIDEDNLVWMEAKFGAVGAIALNSGIYN